MTTALFPPPKVQFSDSNGAPLSGGKVYFYEPGTVTPKDTYSDYSGSTANTNPVVLDSRGEAAIRLNGRYDVVVKDSSGSTVYSYSDVVASLDDLTATHSTGGAAGTVSDNIDRHEGFSGWAAMLAEIDAKGVQNGKTYNLRYHTAKDDRGGDEFYGVTGAAASTYTNDGGLSMIPTGGDGSAAILRNWTHIHPRMWGAVEGSDSATALQSAINAWLDVVTAGKPCRLVIDRYYTFGTKLTFTLNANVSGGASIDMKGGGLLSTVASGNSVEFNSTAEIRGLSVYDWMVRGSGTDAVCTLINGGASASSQFFYNMRWFNTRIENAANIGIHCTGDYFESEFISPGIICTSTAVGDYGMRIEKGSETPSSIMVRDASIRGGEYCLYSDIGNINIDGGTFIESGKECVYLNNVTGGGIRGAHVENAYLGTTYGTGDYAGIYLVNQGYVRDCYGTSSASKPAGMNTVAQVYSGSNGIDASGLMYSGDTTQSLIVLAASGHVRTDGVKRADCAIANTATEKLVSFRNNGIVKTNSTATGTININVDEQDVYEGTATGNITFGAPTNPVAGDVLTISLTQDATGGRTVTWNAVFVVKTVFDPTASKKTTWTFYYTGGAWTETGAAYQNKSQAVSDATTGGTGSAGAGNQYVELEIAGTTYKVLHDGTV